MHAHFIKNNNQKVQPQKADKYFAKRKLQLEMKMPSNHRGEPPC
jgi:hypothetical protein